MTNKSLEIPDKQGLLNFISYIAYQRAFLVSIFILCLSFLIHPYLTATLALLPTIVAWIVFYLLKSNKYPTFDRTTLAVAILPVNIHAVYLRLLLKKRFYSFKNKLWHDNRSGEHNSIQQHYLKKMKK